MQRQKNNPTGSLVIKIGFKPDFAPRVNAIGELLEEGVYSYNDTKEILESEIKRCLSLRSYRN